ncbi:MAG: hypothetical protein LBI03_07725 [Clostridiales bacterium]|jgi:hypothetical protein|nr:hypothetical protein [Clostridiales bacterium]
MKHEIKNLSSLPDKMELGVRQLCEMILTDDPDNLSQETLDSMPIHELLWLATESYMKRK